MKNYVSKLISYFVFTGMLLGIVTVTQQVNAGFKDILLNKDLVYTCYNALPSRTTLAVLVPVTVGVAKSVHTYFDNRKLIQETNTYIDDTEHTFARYLMNNSIDSPFQIIGNQNDREEHLENDNVNRFIQMIENALIAGKTLFVDGEACSLDRHGSTHAKLQAYQKIQNGLLKEMNCLRNKIMAMRWYTDCPLLIQKVLNDDSFTRTYSIDDLYLALSKKEHISQIDDELKEARQEYKPFIKSNLMQNNYFKNVFSLRWWKNTITCPGYQELCSNYWQLVKRYALVRALKEKVIDKKIVQLKVEMGNEPE